MIRLRQYAVPTLFDERPREIGGLISFRQAGYLGGGLVIILAVLVGLPFWAAMPFTGVITLLCGTLAFGRARGMPADQVLWYWARYLVRPREAVWKREGERVVG